MHFNFALEHNQKNNNLIFDVSDDELLFHARIGTLPVIEEKVQAIKDALNYPIDCASLKDVVKDKNDVVIIVDDLTRSTPQEVILPIVLNELNEAGILDSMVSVVIALGTHRPMTEQEILARFGTEVVGRVKVLNHDAMESECVDLGVTEKGTPIQINRLVYNSSVKIAIGTVVPHPLAGWGGGGKMVQPGVSSSLTTDQTHYLGGTYDKPLELVGNPENFIRREMEGIAKKVKVDFIINSVQDVHGNLVGIFAGDLISAHRSAVRCAEKIFRPLIPAPADIVVVNAHPADLDYWQGFKPFVFAQLAVKEGGAIVFYIEAREGVSGGAPIHRQILLDWATQEPEVIFTALESGEIEDRNCGGICVSQAKLLKRARVFCISPGMTDDEIEKLGFTPVRSIEEGIAAARSVVRKQPQIGVIPFGGETIVMQRAGK